MHYELYAKHFCSRILYHTTYTLAAFNIISLPACNFSWVFKWNNSLTNALIMLLSHSEKIRLPMQDLIRY